MLGYRCWCSVPRMLRTKLEPRSIFSSSSSCMALSIKTTTSLFYQSFDVTLKRTAQMYMFYIWLHYFGESVNAERDWTTTLDCSPIHQYDTNGSSSGCWAHADHLGWTLSHRVWDSPWLAPGWGLKAPDLDEVSWIVSFLNITYCGHTFFQFFLWRHYQLCSIVTLLGQISPNNKAPWITQACKMWTWQLMEGDYVWSFTWMQEK